VEVRPERVIADLRELDRLTGGPDGARRVCWTPVWQEARDLLRRRLAEIEGVSVEVDEAGNLWARLPGEVEEAVAVGSHIDSVPNGGWLDGALGVMAGAEVLRAAAEARADNRSSAGRRGAVLVDFADEEGARFGRSLFGSSAVAGTLDPDALRDLTDADGRGIAEVLAEHGVELDRAPGAAARRKGLAAYLELHIEQGPVLESEGIAVAAVTGTFGVERHRFTFTGQASHAGTTPMKMRRDAGLGAARLALRVEEIAREHRGVGTTGVLRLEPGIPTAVPGKAELVVDLRHAEAGPLAAMLDAVRAAAQDATAGPAAGAGAASGRTDVAEDEVWRIEPIPFDERLVAAALDAAGTGLSIPSGALHDAAEMARHVPTAMMFTSSTNGLSHAPEEDTPEDHLEQAIAAFGRLAAGVIAGDPL
jgi:hydantoinase/carbamoylase family amidase